ncbi:hypothetical protein [uncultured Hoeflea sp.]|uniref:hypothetical protein n=1 Tax=uncultured Hoeflea sp. TaxID=538666 RepID=UPI0030ED7669|tara:strand:- start:2898 stop:3545 length:648 start_codon:yes stop_codon:yes gene_type:complete
MIDPDDSDDLNRWVGIMNKAHGYGGVFNHETPADKVTVELSTCREWCESIATEFGLSVGEPEHNPNDPPDCFVTVDGQRLDVELIQLVEAEHKQRATNDETPHAGQLFLDMQWSKERLISRLNDVLKKKGDKYERKGKRIDVLLIHTAETWLNSTQAGEWLADVVMERHPNIASVFLLFEYEPGQGMQRWPVFWLYGDLSGARLPPNSDNSPFDI